MTYYLDGEYQTMPEWVIKAASVDPEATFKVLERMKGIWPDDFIELLEHPPFAILVKWPQHIPVDHSED